MACRGQCAIERSDVDLGPAIVVGRYNIQGEGDRKERPDQNEPHAGFDRLLYFIEVGKRRNEGQSELIRT